MLLFQKACDEGDGYGCSGVALGYEGRVQGIDPDDARRDQFDRRAAQAFEATCGRAAPGDCLEAAARLSELDPPRADDLAARGTRDALALCEDEPRDAMACVTVANWYERAGDARAEGYWRRACDLGIRAVCRAEWSD
jgi:hypothetical protein